MRKVLLYACLASSTTSGSWWNRPKKAWARQRLEMYSMLSVSVALIPRASHENPELLRPCQLQSCGGVDVFVPISRLPNFKLFY
jgi:hypothetical protein